MESKFTNLYNQIITEQKEAGIIKEGFFSFGDKSASKEKAILCKQNWAEKNWPELISNITQYKKKYKKQFNNDADAKFYYGMLMLKNLVHESKLNLSFKSIICEAKVESDIDDPDVKEGLENLSVKDVKKLKRKALLGNKDAIYDLAICYYIGGPVTPKNIEKAVKLFKKAAEKGVPEAQYNLGVIYANGRQTEEYTKDSEDKNEFEDFVRKDEKEALKWFYQAATNGYGPAKEAYNSIKSQQKKEGREENQGKLEDADYTSDKDTFKNGLQYIIDAAKQGCKEAQQWLRNNKEKMKMQALAVKL